MQKMIWIINQYASTPETGRGGRHYYLARELEARGYTVYVVAASYTHLLRRIPEVTGGVTIERREGVNMVWIRTPCYPHAHSTKRIWNWFFFGFKLLRLQKILPERPDVILYSSPSLVGYLRAERLARKTSAKLVFEVRDIWPLTLCELGGYSPRHPFIRFLQWVEDRAYRNADVVISNLKNADEHMVHHGLDNRKFHWIPNGISLTEVYDSKPLEERVINQLPKDGFIVGYTGSLGLANCLETLIKAAVLLKSRVDMKFALVGNGKDKEALQRMGEEGGLHNVVFIGAIPKAQIHAVLQRFDALFIGARKSSIYQYGVSPNKLFEYLYAGKPVLYAIESGGYHPVGEANAGLELPAENPQALADAILRLYNMPVTQREEMGQNGRKLAVEQYEYGALARKLENVLF